MRILAFIVFVVAAILAFVSDFTNANISLAFIIGLIAVGLAALAAETWHTWRAS